MTSRIGAVRLPNFHFRTVIHTETDKDTDKHTYKVYMKSESAETNAGTMNRRMNTG